jgi:hypothetical protein
MVIADQFMLACPPYVGGARFMEHCYDVGIELDMHRGLLQPPDPERTVDRLYVSMVRHPYDWLSALYAGVQLQIVPQFDPDLEFLAAKYETFEGFVRKCYEIGEVVGGAFGRYKAHSVLRFEDYPWNMKEFFESLDVPEPVIKRIREKQIQSVYTTLPNATEKHLRKLIVSSEKPFCERYGYHA